MAIAAGESSSIQTPKVSYLKREWWRTSMRVWGYIVREHITPLVMSLVVIMFVFLLQFLMRFIDKLVGKGLDWWTIIQLVAFNLAWMVVLAVPMAVLVSCVMAFGSMGASNELTAMKAAGISLGRMLFPVAVMGTLIAFFDLQFNNNVLPDANHKAKDLMSDIQRKKPTFALEAGQFSDDDAIPGFSILAQKTVPNSSDLLNVTIYDNSTPNVSKVITAKKANVGFARDFKSIVMTLHSGEFHDYSTIQPADYRRGAFDTYIVNIPTNGYDFMRQGESERGDRELSANDLLRYVHRKDTDLIQAQHQLADHLDRFALDYNKPSPIPPRPILPGEHFSDSAEISKPRAPGMDMIRNQFQQRLQTISSDVDHLNSVQDDIDSYMVEVHKKYAIPVACIVFVLLGAPMGALARRGGVGVGVGLSIGFFVLYWIFLIGGEKLADRNVIEPWEGMWGGNILLGALGIYLVWRVATERPSFSIAKYFSFIRFRKKATSEPLAGDVPVAQDQ